MLSFFIMLVIMGIVIYREFKKPDESEETSGENQEDKNVH